MGRAYTGTGKRGDPAPPAVTFPTTLAPKAGVNESVTWDQLRQELDNIAGAWTEDNGGAVLALAERIRVGWDRYCEAMRAGEHGAAARVLAKIGALEREAAGLDSLCARMLLIRGLLTMRSLAGDYDIRVIVEGSGWVQRVHP